MPGRRWFGLLAQLNSSTPAQGHHLRPAPSPLRSPRHGLVVGRHLFRRQAEPTRPAVALDDAGANLLVQPAGDSLVAPPGLGRGRPGRRWLPPPAGLGAARVGGLRPAPPHVQVNTERGLLRAQSPSSAAELAERSVSDAAMRLSGGPRPNVAWPANLFQMGRPPPQTFFHCKGV